MKDKILVSILPSGTEAREVNALGEEPIRYVPFKHAGYYTDRDKAAIRKYQTAHDAWQAAEESLRTFELEAPITDEYSKKILCFGSIHEAIELPNGKIRIIT